MSRVAPKITCSADVRAELERRAGSRTEAARTVDRACMILGCLSGLPVQTVATHCRTRANTVIKWRDRFVAHGLPGLDDAPRPGARKVYDDAFRRRVLATLEQPPPTGQAVWDGPAVA
jgi:transposase